ncbi:MAG: DUF3883 domain-containing protein [Gammaproteobacteria bacterium]
MERYQGLKHGDQIIGGGSYVKEEGRGHEVCNFAPNRNILYGYVQPPGVQINIERIGAAPHNDSVSGVTVVWTATRPTGGTAVIGWYKDATVFRDYQHFSRPPAIQRQNGIDGYRIKGPLNEAKLLPVDERTLEIPRQVKGGMGQANVWYADKPESASIVKRALELVGGKRARTVGAKGRKGRQDQERKAQIERAAIHLCCAHFEGLGYSVESVEKDNVGWDLVAVSGKTLLRIEVKGLSESSFSVELTPNEYKAFSDLSDAYRLAVVTNALDSPELFVCRYRKGGNMWAIDDKVDRSLQIEIKQSASIKCI